MTAQLKQAGFASAGTPNLSLMTVAASTPASNVHSTRFSIDEEGAEGSSYFLGLMAGSIPQGMPEPRAIVFDRPFVFALVSATGQPLFVGRSRPAAAVPPRPSDTAFVVFSKRALGKTGPHGSWPGIGGARRTCFYLGKRG